MRFFGFVFKGYFKKIKTKQLQEARKIINKILAIDFVSLFL